MSRLQDLVRAFHRDVTKQPCSPAEPKLRTPHLRTLLIIEEAIEIAFALVGPARAQTYVHEMLIKVLNKHVKSKASDEPNVIAVIGELVDLQIVTAGTAEDIGVDLDPFVEEVMAANFRKVGGPVDENGKIGKPPGWVPANLQDVFDRVTQGCEVIAEHVKQFTQFPKAQCVRCGKSFHDPSHQIPCRGQR